MLESRVMKALNELVQAIIERLTAPMPLKAVILWIIGCITTGVVAMFIFWLAAPARTEQPVGLGIYDRTTQLFITWFTWFAIACIIASGRAYVSQRHELHVFVWAAWLVIPPIWFLVEYFYIYPYRGDLSEQGFASLKYGQTIASRAWAIGVAVGGAVLFKDLNVGLAKARIRDSAKKTTTGTKSAKKKVAKKKATSRGGRTNPRSGT